MSRRTGHTFLELLLAVSIAGLVLAALSRGLNVGLKVYERSRDPVAAQAQASLDRLSRDVRSAFLSPALNSSLAFVGSPQSLRFIASQPLPSGAGPQRADLRQVRYFLLPEKQNALSRLLVAQQDGGVSSDESEEQIEVLCNNIKTLKIAFFDGQQWQGFWNSTQNLPEAVRFSMTIVSRRSRTEGDAFTTIVDIPGW